MVGYGSEDEHFVVELTYNYGIKQYKLGNDFQVQTLSCRPAPAPHCRNEVFLCKVGLAGKTHIIL